MGITNLLPFLEKSSRPVHISEFRGQTVAIDSYCWLHRGAICCAEQLVKGEQTTQYLNYSIKLLKLLIQHDIQPIMVFDGCHLPAKKETEIKRRENRDNAKKQAIEMLHMDRIEDARKCFKKCIDIDYSMALALIEECRKLYIECIVAPYESDAQLAYFSLNGIANVIITEDSDLVVYGCSKVLYKMDPSGYGQLVEGDKIYLSLNMKPEQYSLDKFRYICILSGCDYIDSLPGIGLKKAMKFINMTAETNPEIFLDRIPRYLNMRHLVVDESYKKKFMIADATFKHQIVYNPRQKKLIHLHDLEKFNTKSEYCENAGKFLEEDVAYDLCLGNLNPKNLKRVSNWYPDTLPVDKLPTSNHYSLWTNYSRVSTKIKREEKKNSAMQMFLKYEVDQENRYDEKLAEELAVYTKTVKNENDFEESETKTTKESSIKLSPVIGGFERKPFLNHFSKFSKTHINDKVLVRSRFFSPSSSSLCTSSSENVDSDFCSGISTEDGVNDDYVEVKLEGSITEIVVEPEIDIKALDQNYEKSVPDTKKRKLIVGNHIKMTKKPKTLAKDKNQPSLMNFFTKKTT